MKTKKEIVAIVGNYYNCMTALKGEFISARGEELVKCLDGKVGQDAHDALANIVETIKSHIKGAAVEAGIGIPAYRTSVRTYEESEASNKVKELEVDFRNKLNSDIDFTRKFSFDATDAGIVAQIYDAFISVMNELAYIEQAQEVLTEVNATLAQIKEEHPEITVDVTFGYSDSAEGAIVLDITDTAIKFAAPLSGILEATNMGMFQSGDSFDELCRTRDVNAYVESMSTIQFAPQVIKGNIAIVVKMLDMKINRRADKILRRTYHKKAEFLTKQKAGIGYYSEDVEKSDSIIFALVSKEDDKYAVKLSPFDVKTLEKVKCDVLKKCGLK